MSPAAADRLLSLFSRAGCRQAEPAVLQPAQLFVDLSGEDIRRRLFLTSDAEGRELCLRPEFTIPVARDYLASAEAGKRADFAYLGPVFRLRPGESGEFVQAGAEFFGRSDIAAADAEAFALALEAVADLGLPDAVLHTGDAGLFAALLSALEVAAPLRRRLSRAYASGRLAETVAMAAGGEQRPAPHAGVLAAIEGQDPAAARAFVEDVLKIGGIESVGGRSAADIAARFLEQAAERSSSALSLLAAATLTEFSAITGNPDDAAQALRDLARRRGVDLDTAIDRFEERTGFLAARGVDPTKIVFSAGTGRNLDYYTGFVFELHDPKRTDGKPVAGGGRYDGLLAALGARGATPAVGFSIWPDRIAGAAR